MTLIVLFAMWIALMLLVRPREKYMSRLTVGAQATVALAASVGLFLVPLAFAVVTLSGALSTSGGLSLRNCGRLLGAIINDPFGRLDLTFGLLFVIAAPVALVRGVASAWRSQSAARALALCSSRDGLVVAPASQPWAFTAGLLRPRVVVSEGLVAHVRPEFLCVVLEHEGAHRRGRHPLLLFVGQTMARALPLPPLRWAADALRFALEARADDYAVRRTEDRGLVAEAVATLALSSVDSATGFEGDEVRRVRRLLAPEPSARIGTPVVVASLFALLIFAGGHTAHCAAQSAKLPSAIQCRFD